MTARMTQGEARDLVSCPYCGSAKGEQCRSWRSSRFFRESLHLSRWAKALRERKAA